MKPDRLTSPGEAPGAAAHPHRPRRALRCYWWRSGAPVVLRGTCSLPRPSRRIRASRAPIVPIKGPDTTCWAITSPHPGTGPIFGSSFGADPPQDPLIAVSVPPDARSRSSAVAAPPRRACLRLVAAGRGRRSTSLRGRPAAGVRRRRLRRAALVRVYMLVRPRPCRGGQG